MRAAGLGVVDRAGIFDDGVAGFTVVGAVVAAVVAVGAFEEFGAEVDGAELVDVAEPAEAAPESTLAAETAAVAAISFPTAAAVPLPTGRGFPLRQHVFRLLLLFVLRKLHVLRGPTG